MLIGHTLRYLPAQLLSPLAQLVAMVAWTHWLAPAEMGVYTLVTVTQEIAYLGCLGWFSVYALRFLPPADDPAGRRRYLGTENVVVLASLAGSALVALASLWMMPAEQRGPMLWLSMAAFFASKALCAHYAERARAQAAFASYTLLQLAGPVGGLALGWLAMRDGAPTAVFLLGAYAVAQFAGTLVAMPGLGMRWRLQRPDAQLLRSAIGFGAPLLGLAAMGWLAENYIRYLVQWLSGTAALGLMVVGWALGRRCASVASMVVATAAFPIASRLLNEGRRDEALQHLRVNAAMILAVLAPCTAGVLLLGPALVSLTVAQEYREVTSVLLGWSMLAGALRNLHAHTTDQLMVLERRNAMLGRLYLVEFGVCALASVLGLQLAGLAGAVIGQAAGSGLALGLSLWQAQRRLGFVWPGLASLKIGVASLVMLALLALLDLPGNTRGLVLGSGLGAVVYAATMALLFSPEWRRWRLASAA